MSEIDEIAKKHGLTPAPAPAPPQMPESMPSTTTEPSAANFAELAGERASLGGSHKMKALGTWLAGKLGPQEEIPREYGAGGEAGDIVRNSKAQAAQIRADNPRMAAVADTMGMAAPGIVAGLSPAVLAARAAAMGVSVPMLVSALAAPEGTLAGAGAAGLVGGGMAAVQGANESEATSPAGIANDVARAGLEGGIKSATVSGALGAAGAGMSQAAPAAGRFGNWLRGLGAGGAGTAKAIRDLEGNLNPRIRSATDLGAAIERQNLPGQRVLPVSAHGYEQLATERLPGAAQAIDEAAARASEGIPQGRMSPIPVASSAQAQGAAGETIPPPARLPRQPTEQELADTEARLALTQSRRAATVRPGKRGAQAAPLPPQEQQIVPPSAPDAFAPPVPIEQPEVSAPAPHGIDRAAIEDALHELLAKAESNTTDKGVAYSNKLADQLRKLQNKPETLTPSDVLALKRQLMENAKPEKGSAQPIPGTTEAYRDYAAAVRGILNEHMAQTPEGPAFQKANEDYADLATIRDVAGPQGRRQRAIGPLKQMELLSLVGSAAAGHGLEGAATIAGAEGAMHWGTDLAATGAKGLSRGLAGAGGTLSSAAAATGAATGATRSSDAATSDPKYGAMLSARPAGSARDAAYSVLLQSDPDFKDRERMRAMREQER